MTSARTFQTPNLPAPPREATIEELYSHVRRMRVALADILGDLGFYVNRALLERETNADMIDESALRKWAGVSGADVTATSTAFLGLVSRVEETEEGISSNSQAIIELTNNLESLGGTVSGQGAAILDLTSRVESAENDILVNTNALIEVNSAIEDLTLDVEANSSAILDLDSAVSILEGEVSGNSSAILGVQSDLGDLLSSPAENLYVLDTDGVVSEATGTICHFGLPDGSLPAPPSVVHVDLDEVGIGVGFTFSASAECSISSGTGTTALVTRDAAGNVVRTITGPTTTSSTPELITIAQGVIREATERYVTLQITSGASADLLIQKGMINRGPIARPFTLPKLYGASAAAVLALESRVTEAEGDILANSEAILAVESSIENMAFGPVLNAGSAMTSLTQWFTSPEGTTTLKDSGKAWTVETPTDPVAGPSALQIVNNDNSSDNMWSAPIPIDRAKSYTVSVWVRQPSGNRRNYLAVNFKRADGTDISGGTDSNATGWLALGTYHYWGIANAAFPSEWTYYEFSFGADGEGTFPDAPGHEAVFMQIGALLARDAASSPTETTIQIQKYQVVDDTGAVIAASAVQSLSSEVAVIDGEVTSIGANWTVSVDVNNRVNGMVTLDASANKSTFAVLADKFTIYNNSIDYAPFEVIGGQVYIKNATIQNAAITSAKIGDLQVTTLKIANNAVTVPVSAYTDGEHTFTSASGWVVTQSVSLTTSGQRIFISFTGRFRVVVNGSDPLAGISVRIRRGSTTIFERGPDLATLMPFAISFSEAPSAGTHTYTVECSTQNDHTLGSSKRSLYVIETKK